MENFETIWCFDGDHRKLAEKEGNEIAKNRIKCKNCGNISKFTCLSKYQDASIYRNYIQGQGTKEIEMIQEVHWDSDYLYLLSCPQCKQVHLCKFTTSSEQEELYQNHIEMCIESDAIGEPYSFVDPLERCNFQILYPQYTYKELLDDEIVGEILPEFMEIYHQAQKAEQLSLDKISGMAYRKALEFLIKGFAIHKNPDKKEKIQNHKYFLNNCINDYYGEMINVQKCAQIAVWLGNDETHYTRKWKEKDINDLKNLIKIVIYGINMDILSDKYRTEMNP